MYDTVDFLIRTALDYALPMMKFFCYLIPLTGTMKHFTMLLSRWNGDPQVLWKTCFVLGNNGTLAGSYISGQVSIISTACSFDKAERDAVIDANLIEPLLIH